MAQIFKRALRVGDQTIVVEGSESKRGARLYKVMGVQKTTVSVKPLDPVADMNVRTVNKKGLRAYAGLKPLRVVKSKAKKVTPPQPGRSAMDPDGGSLA